MTPVGRVLVRLGVAMTDVEDCDRTLTQLTAMIQATDSEKLRRRYRIEQDQVIERRSALLALDSLTSL